MPHCQCESNEKMRRMENDEDDDDDVIGDAFLEEMRSAKEREKALVKVRH